MPKRSPEQCDIRCRLDETTPILPKNKPDHPRRLQRISPAHETIRIDC